MHCPGNPNEARQAPSDCSRHMISILTVQARMSWSRNSGGVGLHRIEGEAVAGDENIIDVVSGLAAVAGRHGRGGAAR